MKAAASSTISRVPVGAIPDFIARASAAAERVVPGCRPVPFGHFGDGNVHFNVSQPVGMERSEYLRQWDDMADAVHEIVISLDARSAPSTASAG